MSPRSFAMLLGAIAIVAAVAALFWPIKLDAHAPNSSDKISCGSAIDTKTDDAAQADRVNSIGRTLQGGASLFDETNYEQQCKDAAGTRKTWAIPLGIVGLVVLTGARVIQTGPKAQPAQ